MALTYRLIQTPQLPKIKDPGTRIAELCRGRNVDVQLNRYYGKTSEYMLPDHYLFNPLIIPDARLTSGFPPACDCTEQAGDPDNTSSKKTKQTNVTKLNGCVCKGLYNRPPDQYGNFGNTQLTQIPECHCQGPSQFVYQANSTFDRMASHSHNVRFHPSRQFNMFSPPYHNNSLTISPSHSSYPYIGYKNSSANPYRKHVSKNHHRLHSSFPNDIDHRRINTKLGYDQSYNCMNVPPLLDHRSVNCPNRNTRYSELYEVPSINRSYCFNSNRSKLKCRTPYTIKHAYSQSLISDFNDDKIKVNEMCNIESRLEEKRNTDKPIAESNNISISNQNIGVENAGSNLNQDLLRQISPKLPGENCCDNSLFAYGCQVTEPCETPDFCSCEDSEQPKCIRCGEQVNNKVPRCIRCGDRVANTFERDICCNNIVSETTCDPQPRICKSSCKTFSKYDNCKISDCEETTIQKELSEGSSCTCCLDRSIEKICSKSTISQNICPKPCPSNINHDETCVNPRSSDCSSSVHSTKYRSSRKKRRKSSSRAKSAKRKWSFTKSAKRRKSDSCACAFPEASIHCNQCGKKVSGKRKRKRRSRYNKNQKIDESESCSSDASTIRIIKVCNIHGKKKNVKVIKKNPSDYTCPLNETESSHSSTCRLKNDRNSHNYSDRSVSKNPIFQSKIAQSCLGQVSNEIVSKKNKRLSGIFDFLNRKRPTNINRNDNKMKIKDERVDEHSECKIGQDNTTERYKVNRSMSLGPSEKAKHREEGKISLKRCRRSKEFIDFNYLNENSPCVINRNRRCSHSESTCSSVYAPPSQFNSSTNSHKLGKLNSHCSCHSPSSDYVKDKYPLPRICEESTEHIPISSANDRTNSRIDPHGYRNKYHVGFCNNEASTSRLSTSRRSPENLNLPGERHENKDRESIGSDFESDVSSTISKNQKHRPNTRPDECIENYLPPLRKYCKKLKVSSHHSNYGEPRINENVPTCCNRKPSNQSNLGRATDFRDLDGNKHVNNLLVDSSKSNNGLLNNNQYRKNEHNNEDQTGPNTSANTSYDAQINPVVLECSEVNNAFQDNNLYVKSENDYVSNFNFKTDQFEHDEFSNGIENSGRGTNLGESAANNILGNFGQRVELNEQLGKDARRPIELECSNGEFTSLNNNLYRKPENNDITDQSTQIESIDSDKICKATQSVRYNNYEIDPKHLNKASFNYDINVQNISDREQSNSKLVQNNFVNSTGENNFETKEDFIIENDELGFEVIQVPREVIDCEGANGIFVFAPHELIEKAGTDEDHIQEIYDEISCSYLIEHKNKLNLEDRLNCPSQIEDGPPKIEDDENLYCEAKTDLLNIYTTNECVCHISSPNVIESKSQILLKKVLRRLDSINLDDLDAHFRGNYQTERVILKEPKLQFKSNKTCILKKKVSSGSKSFLNRNKLSQTLRKFRKPSFPSEYKHYIQKMKQDYRRDCLELEHFEREHTVLPIILTENEEQPQLFPNDFNRCEISGRFGENVSLCIEHVQANKSLENSQSGDNEAIKDLSKYKYGTGAIESSSTPKMTICNMVNVTYDRDENGVERRSRMFGDDDDDDDEWSQTNSTDRNNERPYHLKRKSSQTEEPIRKRRHARRTNDRVEEEEYGLKRRRKSFYFQSRRPLKVFNSESKRSSTAPELISDERRFSDMNQKRRGFVYHIAETVPENRSFNRESWRGGQNDSVSVYDRNYRRDSRIHNEIAQFPRGSEGNISFRISKSHRPRDSQMDRFHDSSPSRHTVYSHDYYHDDGGGGFNDDAVDDGGGFNDDAVDDGVNVDDDGNDDDDRGYNDTTDDQNMEAVELIVDNPCLCNQTVSSSNDDSVKSESLDEIFPGVRYKLTNKKDVDIVSMLSKLLGLPYEAPPIIKTKDENEAVKQGNCACETSCCTCQNKKESVESTKARSQIYNEKSVIRNYELRLRQLNQEEMQLTEDLNESDRRAKQEMEDLQSLKDMIRAERKKLFYEEWRLRNIKSHLEKVHFSKLPSKSQTEISRAKGTYTDKIKEARIESSNRYIEIQRQREIEDEKERNKQREREIERALEEEETRKESVKQRKRKKKSPKRRKVLSNQGTISAASSSLL